MINKNSLTYGKYVMAKSCGDFYQTEKVLYIVLVVYCSMVHTPPFEMCFSKVIQTQITT
jgi:cell division protein FtsL